MRTNSRAAGCSPVFKRKPLPHHALSLRPVTEKQSLRTFSRDRRLHGPICRHAAIRGEQSAPSHHFVTGRFPPRVVARTTASSPRQASSALWQTSWAHCGSSSAASANAAQRPPLQLPLLLEVARAIFDARSWRRSSDVRVSVDFLSTVLGFDRADLGSRSACTGQGRWRSISRRSFREATAP